MRKKTETKRQTILDVAAEAFRESGFARTSMSEICSRVGGSKATLYNYFASKEELFFEVMFLSLEAELEATHAWLEHPGENVAETLRSFGRRLLALAYSSEMMAARRLIIAESGRSNLGRLCFERGRQRSESVLTEFLRAAMAKGKLREADARVAAQQLYGLLDAELLDRLLLGVRETVTKAEIRKVTQRAIDVFMAAYGR